MRWLFQTGDRRSVIGTVARIALAVMLLPAGIGKFVNYDEYVDRFTRWDVGAPGTSVVLAGLGEVVAGVTLLLGVVPRIGALSAIGVMLGAMATAGRVDGGEHIWLPLILIGLATVVVVRGAGRWTAPFGPGAGRSSTAD